MSIKGIRRITSLAEVPRGDYVGYYWLSDSKTPIMIDENNPFDHSVFKVNPFIIEGMLWNEKEQTSIMIAHTGRYNIFEYKVKDISTVDGAILESKNYIAHKMKAKSMVSFKQLWIAESDPLCVDSKVLKMKAQIFTGFDKTVGNSNHNK
jgi:CRISPR type III-associated protein (TIGR04423 family)